MEVLGSLVEEAGAEVLLSVSKEISIGDNNSDSGSVDDGDINSFYDESVSDDFDDFPSPALGKARCQLGLGWRHLRYQLTQIQQLKQL